MIFGATARGPRGPFASSAGPCSALFLAVICVVRSSTVRGLAVACLYPLWYIAPGLISWACAGALCLSRSTTRCQVLQGSNFRSRLYSRKSCLDAEFPNSARRGFLWVPLDPAYWRRAPAATASSFNPAVPLGPVQSPALTSGGNINGHKESQPALGPATRRREA